MTDYSALDTVSPDAPLPADESPTTESHRLGPDFQPTHPFALAPVTSPPHSVDGFVKEFLRRAVLEALTAQGGVLTEVSGEHLTKALDDLLDSSESVTRALLGVPADQSQPAAAPFNRRGAPGREGHRGMAYGFSPRVTGGAAFGYDA